MKLFTHYLHKGKQIYESKSGLYCCLWITSSTFSHSRVCEPSTNTETFYVPNTALGVEAHSLVNDIHNK